MEDSEKKLEVAEPVEEVAEETTVVDEKTQDEPSEEFTEQEGKVEEESIEPSKKVQSDEENANYAQIRRKAEEEANKKIEEAKTKAYEEGRLAAYKGKINPYTGKPMTDLPDALSSKKREETKAIQEKKELEEKTKQEINDFTNKYPDVDLKELLDDSFFKDYIQGKQKSLTELYEGFNNFKNAFRNSAINVAKQTIANAQASPGSLKGDSDNTIDYASMSDAEFEKYIQRAKDGDL